MDRISSLPDEVLVKILLLLSTKDGVSTSVLSKRWEFLFMWLPRIGYGDTRGCSVSEVNNLRTFLHRNLPLHKAPVIEILCLEFSDLNVEPKDMKLWIMTAVSRIIHELFISYESSQLEQNILPSNLFTCKSLVALKIYGKILLDVPRMVCLPCLKTLHLVHVIYFNEGSLQRLVSNCHVLDDLMVRRKEGEIITKFIVSVPALQSFTLFIPDVVEDQNILPRNLYTCKSLVTLILEAKILIDVPRAVCLPTLKTLHLKSVLYVDEDSLQQLLSNCSALEDLLVHFSQGGGNLQKFTVIVPSLQRLSLYIFNDVDEFVINTPSLEYFELVHENSKRNLFSVENMPKLSEAHVDVRYLDLKSLFRSITSVKRLDICVTADSLEAVYGDGFVFTKLERLHLCSCEQHFSNVLVWLLKDSPNLRFLVFNQMDSHYNEGLVSWTQPSTVPECMLSSLQTFEWSEYSGRPQERDIVSYILENTGSLKTATISTYEDGLDAKLKMVKELALCSRASTACKLVFDWGFK